MTVITEENSLSDWLRMVLSQHYPIMNFCSISSQMLSDERK